jgi:hypothetical protein
VAEGGVLVKGGDNVTALSPALFSPGEIMITPEAFQSLKDAGLTPADLVNRHVRGDWNDGPTEWTAKNKLSVSGQEEWPIMSVYRLHPGETRICVGTTMDRSQTSLSVWPEPDGHRPLMPVEMAERVSNESGRLAQPTVGRSVREILDGWGRDKTVSATRMSGKGPTVYGPER